MSDESAPGRQGGSQPEDQLLIRIKTLEPATYELAVPRQLTIADLKTRLEGVAQDAPSSRQRVIFRGRACADELTLQEIGGTAVGSCGIEDGDTMHMVVRPPDAPPPQAAPGAPNAGAPQRPQERLEADTRR
ncbi:hypothetical protein TSOC_000987, partial [Tetrabaena socialis]